MARTELDVLLDKVEDDALRSELAAHVARLRARRSYGLVFESHLPERVRLPDHPVRRGTTVVRRADRLSPSFEVRSTDDTVAVVRRIRHPDGAYLAPDELLAVADERIPLAELVTIADFGQPVHPGFRSLGSIERGGDRPSHVVIKGENHHVLEALRFSHAGKVDCIYLDPPYNTGARDWKYDNDYVDDADAYRHSKWLAFMERRLTLAKELLNPADAVLIVTIDEKEYLRLGLLLEQLFPTATHQMVTTVIKPEGTGRVNEFSRTNEFIFFVLIGDARIAATADNMYDRDGHDDDGRVEWRNLRRREATSVRGSRPRQFYAVFVDERTGAIHSVGEPIGPGVDRRTVEVPAGTRAVFPLNPAGTEMIWSKIPSALRALVERGYARSNGHGIQFLNTGTVAAIERGEIAVTGRDASGAVIVERVGTKRLMPKTVWTRESHNAQTGGTLLLAKLIPGRRFPFPKSLYAVEDALRFVVAHKPDAVVLDFFGGSGTTTHAVARLNRQDGGRRQSIVVTNNEVSAAEATALAEAGRQPGDPEWEALGIFEHVTRPRVTAAITGRRPDGSPIEGAYRFTDEFDMAEGFAENVELLELTYLDPDDVEVDLAFPAVAPLLWLRAGAAGPMITERFERFERDGEPEPFRWTERYGVLFSPDRWRAFVTERPATATTAYVLTDAPSTFAGIAAELPHGMDVVRLYDSYSTTFDELASRAR